MKVALVHEMLVKMGGAERVLDALQEMFPEAPIYTLLYDQAACGKTFSKEKIHTSQLQKWQEWGVPRQLLVGHMPTAVEMFDFSEFDLVISSSSAFAHGIIVPAGTKHLCYCHSPMRYAWDYTHEYVAEKTSGSFGWLIRPFLRRLLRKLRLWDFSAANRPDVILANSATTQKRIQKFWRQEADIVFPPVDIKRFTVTPKNQDYFLIVSALTGFKRLDIAIQAFNRLPKHRLVIIGDGAEKQKLQSMAEKNIEFLGRKDDAAVTEFMQNCRALIFPGLEDFGITPVEAMAAGKPVIAYGQGGVTESVVSDETGVFFPELNPESLEEALAHFFTLEKQGTFDPQKCRKQAEKFSREKFEEGIMRAIKELMSAKVSS